MGGKGMLNDALFQSAKEFFRSKSYQILETKVEAGYDPAEEVEKHWHADIVILQMPVHWFSSPWIHKKYLDEVFNIALEDQKLVSDDGRSRQDPSKQYGTGGHMQGRKFMICATWHAPASSFNNPTQIMFKGKSTSDVFLSISSNYSFCGYDIVPDYNCFDVYKGVNVTRDLENYPKYLASVFDVQV